MLSNFRTDDIATVRLQGCESALFINAHSSAVPGDVGCEDGGQPPLYALFNHVPPIWEIVTAQIAILEVIQPCRCRLPMRRIGSVMSALGQKPTFAPQNVMSALPQKRTFAVQLGMSALGQ